MIYLSLFVISFLAATILPFSSELTLAGLIATSDYDNLLLFIVASFGNVLGSVVNWALGSYSRNLTTKKWFPFKETQIERSSKWFRKFGKWSLLFAWVPVVGDPLTLVAGISRVKFIDFIILVAIGKVSRYLIVFYLIG
ncbi:DedA family protein [Candidatus Pelagibacter sp.]|nr:DedA family protein [Candidatus Pelagibacter sp.]MDB3959583.1 DedA family protein [Candidatus Pelagibacter sp.]MDC0452889.1 DedA family protein [Candidatus Pelagibacter sp.]MDC3331825.1 DedA family protein [Candidatus Pelagibacter sp.]MDC6477659.1 DedA family protein [Candidatus Pelagibacter sp.]